MPERIPQSATIRVPLQAYLSSDHVSAATGKTIVITISKNGAAYGNPSAGATNATEISSGSYYVDLSTTDTGTVGPLFVRGTASGMDDAVAIYDVGGVTVTTNNDKTGYALTSAYDAAKTAAQAGNAMALTSGERSTLSSVIMSDVTDTVGANVVLILAGINTLTGANAVETGISLLQSHRAILAACCGVLTTAGQNPEVFKNPSGAANRISVANDASGNRSAVTLTL